MPWPCDRRRRSHGLGMAYHGGTMTPPVNLTVVSGLPRSGTSMMMMMLEAGGLPVLTDRTRAADEDNPRGYYEFEPVKKTKTDASWVATATGHVVKIVHVLLYDLPPQYDYRVLLMRRDMKEVIASQTAMLEHQGRAGATLTPERLAQIFADQLQRLAAWLETQPNFRHLEIDHRHVIEDPRGEAQRVATFLGDDLDVPAMAATVDPALYRQRS